MTAHAWIGLIAVIAVPVAMIVGYWWLERDARTGRQDDPFAVAPTQRRMPYDSGVDYRRS